MNPTVDPQQVSSAGKSIVTWLTVLQIVSLASAVVYLILAFLPSNPGWPAGFPREAAVGLAALQVLFAVIYFLILQWTKGWMTNMRLWATGEGAPKENAIARETKTLRGWLVFGQWWPLIVLLLVTPLVWYALGRVDPALLMPPEAPAPTITPEQLRAAAQVGAVIGLIVVGLPSFVINFMVLGWIRRWMTGVADAALGRPERETRLTELAMTISRWFTFFQVLLVLFILLILITPLLPAPDGANSLADRLNLVVSFLNLALWVALLQWSKTFMFGLTARAKRTSSQV